jgi:hypothetical protein
MSILYGTSVLDPRPFHAGTGPTSDPAQNLNADPDPECQLNANPDPGLCGSATLNGTLLFICI